jgi:hypothetical protein
MESLPKLDRTKSGVSSLHDQGKDQYVVDATPSSRLNMVWPLTLQAWTLKDPTIAQSRLQRHIVRILGEKS